MSSRHETPEEFDDSLERDEISPQEYYAAVGTKFDGSYRVGFWRQYWQHPEMGLRAPPRLETLETMTPFRVETVKGVQRARDIFTGRFVKWLFKKILG